MAKVISQIYLTTDQVNRNFVHTLLCPILIGDFLSVLDGEELTLLYKREQVENWFITLRNGKAIGDGEHVWSL